VTSALGNEEVFRETEKAVLPSEEKLSGKKVGKIRGVNRET